ncbi:Sterigmatocystin 8-O-methyltransferase [Termitomyces sp. T112]|nr:Sterigmatocystin 8-O-methyltransferase [Termitomyces sp. T112]
MAGKAHIESLLKLINSSARDALAQYEKHNVEVPLLSSTASHPLDTTDETLELRKAIRVLEGACGQLCTALAPPSHTIVNMGQNLDWLCLLVVIEAKVADALSNHDEGVHVRDLSKSVGIESGKLARILRALATKHVFLEVEPDVFANNRLSLVLLSSSDVACLTLCHTTLAPRAASILYDNLSNPKSAASYDPKDSPFMQVVKDEGIHGTFFNWLKAHPEKRETFGRAMLGLGQVMGSLSVLHHFPWSNFSTVCDVGSGVGAFSLPLAKLWPQLKITLFDLPDTIGHATEHWAQRFPQAQAHNQIDFVSGDFFVSIPIPNQDIYYLRNIIHNWPDVQALQILGSVRKAMGHNSRLLIHDYVLSHVNQTELETAEVERAPYPLLPNYGAGSARTYYQDMTMLVMYISKERTLNESVALASTVGLQLEKVWDLAESSLLEFKVAK